MACIDFPNSPSLNDEFQVGNTIWRWNGVAWLKLGELGPQGFQGAQGLQGNQGLQGSQGDIGLQGSVGPQGLQGLQGQIGAQGNQGNIGAQGSQGFQGGAGPQGYQGTTIVQKTGIVLLDTGWTLVSGLYEYDHADIDITASTIVYVIPSNADIAIVEAAELLPENISSSGEVKLFAKNQPTDDITVTLNLFN